MTEPLPPPTFTKDALNAVMLTIKGMRRTVICHTSLAERLQAIIDTTEAPGLWRIAPSEYCPEDRCYIVRGWFAP